MKNTSWHSGHPWYRKGFDVLMKAFAAAADRIPGYKLRIVKGYSSGGIKSRTSGS